MKITTQKILTRAHASIYRWSKGRVMNKIVGLDVLLLTTTGRKTGQKRTVPLAYLPDGENWVVIASNGGSHHHPGWYINLLASHEAVVSIRGKRYNVRPEMLGERDRLIFWKHAVSVYPGYDVYASRTSRIIPLVRLVKISID